VNLVAYQTNKTVNSLLARLDADDLRGRKLVIYGIGAVARHLTEVLSGHTLVGLMDKAQENIGKTIYGYQVLSCEDVITHADVIIIASSEVYWETIAARIRHLETRHGKTILCTNGDPAGNRAARGSDTQYWNACLDLLQLEIDPYEFISFDIFDTLLCRKIASPDDILQVVDERARVLLPRGPCFLSARKEAELECRRHDPHCDIHQIYEKLGELFLIPQGLIDTLMQMEIETELACSAPRSAMVTLFHHAIAAGKRVFLTSDFHLPAPLLRPMLKKCGISGESGLLISCEAKQSKANGTLWQSLLEAAGRRDILHIGDNDRADIASPVPWGIRSRKVMGCGEMLHASSLRGLAVHATTAQDAMVLGLVQQHLFNNPFALGPTKGVPHIDSLFSFGYLFLGPLLYNYFAWLMDELRRDSFDRVLFLAREGHLLTRLYEELRDMLVLHDLPEGVYFKTSRRMASVASLKSMTDIRETLRDSFSGTARDLLLHRFGIEFKQCAPARVLVNSDPEVARLLEEHESEILKNAEMERRNYLRYMDAIGLREGTRLALADIGLKGSIQYYLGKFFKASFKGFYLSAFTGIANPYGLGNSITALYQEDATTENRSSAVFRYHILFESAMAAPEGMYLKANDDDTFTHGPQFNNQKLFAEKSLIHDGIRAFILDMIELNGKALAPASSHLVEELFALPMSGVCTMDDGIRKTFFVDDQFSVNNEKLIWGE
jgi:FMN phosphatase YigB (HAD superfamily)